ncbi:MAG: hypothetical protein IKN55_02975 [Oscillospiraceae bacterium]|nr:hypothetical protein [Oscillospiraceae bacterium]
MKSVMRDAKALRFARLLRQYCNERPCKDGECIFRQKKSGICTLSDTRLPECWQLDDLREDKADG